MRRSVAGTRNVGEGELSDDGRIRVNEQVSIPRAELTFRATRSAGPGGQHVNTSSTRVELTWEPGASPSLDDEQRARLVDRLARRLDSRGVLRLVEGGSRSQYQNRETVIERFRKLVEAALRPRRRRKKTRPPASAREDRLREKKRRSDTKRRRAPPGSDE